MASFMIAPLREVLAMLRLTHALRHLIALAIILNLSCSEQVVVRETKAECGNAVLDRDEECDDGNEISTDACTTGCTLAVCGDGTMRTDLGAEDPAFEACDDGNDVDEDSCTIAGLKGGVFGS